jgi:type II secretory pathway pseudopilin PulG
MNKQKGIGLLGVVVIVAILAVVGGGAYYSSKNKAEVQTDNSISATSSAEISIKDLLGKNLMCTFSSDENGTVSEGTTYIAGNKIRVDAVTKQGDKVVTESHMIKNDVDSYTYVWASMGAGAGQGAKIKVDANMEVQNNTQASVDWNKKLNYKCDDWNPDQSRFTLPANVTFTDLSAMMNSTTNANVNTGGEVNKCAACDMAPDAASKAQCKAALGCN